MICSAAILAGSINGRYHRPRPISSSASTASIACSAGGLAVLEREFVWRSKWGIRSFRQWDTFYTLELLVNSYLQWCDDNHLFQRQSRAELKDMLEKMYRSERPRRSYPVGEVEQLPPGFDRGPRSDLEPA